MAKFSACLMKKETKNKKERKRESKEARQSGRGKAGDTVFFSVWLSNGYLIVAGLQESR